ncbi:MAG: long-chain-fatty-acid--CoA ligase [Dehalococcoidales bacterium]|nr:long-chain-fatty-acid--CoA ligase [Dehalococcoidales bacterium]
MNTTEFLTITLAICPDKEAIVFEGKRCTFAQLGERTNRLGNALMGLRMKKGESVATLMVNCNQCIETYFATAKIGGVYVPLNFRAKGNELTYMLNTAEATAVFVGERYLELVESIKPNLTTVKHVISVDKPHQGMLFYNDLLKSGSPDDIFTEIGDDDMTILMYTAGTTGFPKGVMLTHKSFTVYVLDNVTPPDTETIEKNILTVPLYHVAGIQAMMAAVYGGRTLVIERQFEPTEWMGLVQTEKVGRAMMVPTMLKQLIDHPKFKDYNLSSLKVITYGAAPMPLEVIKKAINVFPKVSFINAFGQTETASTITSLSPEDHVITGATEAEREKKLKRLGSIGKPMSDVEMRIIDENGKDLPPGEVGEIVARGPRVMTGYWKDEEKTKKTIDKDGWVHTGDTGYRDEDGYFFLAGRATDLIIRGGENISPEEVENVIFAHPKIDDVAVIGVPDEEWGEVPKAICVPKEGCADCTPEEIMEYCRQNLASYKRPRSVIFVKELPRSSVGKVLKRVLRDEYGEKK